MKSHPKLLLAIIAFVLYSPTIFFEYVYMDDYLMVQEGGFYSKIENVPAAFFRPVWHPTGSEYNYYRPASTSGYIVGAWISTLISKDILPWIFHLTNILLQVAVAVLLFAMLREFGLGVEASFFASLILILHPATAGTIGWIPGQNELLLAVAVIGGFVCYVRSLRDRRWFVAHGLCFLLAMLTKENGIGLPILCAMYLLFSERRRSVALWLLSFVTWIVTLGLWIYMAAQGAGGTTPAASSALLGMWNGLPYLLIYLGHLVVPVDLSTLPTPKDTPLHFWVGGIVGAVGLLSYAAWKCRRRPLVLIGVCWFGGFLLPTFANLLPQTKENFILRSDRAYLASIGLLIILLQIEPETWRKWLDRSSVKYAAVALLLILVPLNLQHQFHFSTGMRYYARAVEGSPHSPFAHTHLGDMYLYAKDIPQAIKSYQRAIELNNFEPQAHNNLGVAYMRSGEVDKAAAEYAKELEFNPNNLLTWSNLGAIYLQKGDHANAEVAFRKAVELNPAYKDAWLGLYKIYDFQRRFDKRDEALKMLRSADMDMSKGI